MPRNRYQTGHLRRRGKAIYLDYRVYRRAPGGEETAVRKSELVARIGDGLTVKTAWQEARKQAQQLLRRVNLESSRPSSQMTLAAFAKSRFIPQVVSRKRPAGQKHYGWALRRLLPIIGERRLCDFGLEDVEAAVSRFQEAGYAGQTILHLRNAISAVIRHARRLELYSGQNPARDVELPPVVHERRPTYTWEQIRRLMAVLPSPIREMAWLAVETSMHAAELCGLRRKWLNLTGLLVTVEGEILPPQSVAVRESRYAGKWGGLKTSARRRNVPISTGLVEQLADVLRKAKNQGPDAPAFQGPKGAPIDAHNVSARIFRPLAQRLGFPVAWHAFRRFHSTAAGEVRGISIEDRMRTMGHAHPGLTLYYSVDDLERRRRVPEQITKLLFGITEERLQ